MSYGLGRARGGGKGQAASCHICIADLVKCHVFFTRRAKAGSLYSPWMNRVDVMERAEKATEIARAQPDTLVPAVVARAPGSQVAPMARRDMVVHGDLFAQVVPRAGLDLLLLYDRVPQHSGLDAFQALLRAMCATGRQVDRAGLQDGYISLDVDGIALAFGASRLPQRRSGIFHRPEMARDAFGAARLGYLLYRHQTCQRLRVAEDAPPSLLADVTRLVLHCCPPKAVVVYDSRILLSLAEVMGREPATLSALMPGAIVPRPVARYVRPAAEGHRRRSPFAAGTTARSPAALDKLVTDTIASREEAHLRAVLRPRGRSTATPAPGWRRIAAMGVVSLTAFVWLWGRGTVPF